MTLAEASPKYHKANKVKRAGVRTESVHEDMPIFSPAIFLILRFSRARKRYERQGLLVTATALAEGEEECAADAAERAEWSRRPTARPVY